MIPKFIMPIKDTEKKITEPIYNSTMGKNNCKTCSYVFNTNDKIFIANLKGENIFIAICKSCANSPIMRNNVNYLEDLETYQKRLKAGFFKGWKVAPKN